MIRVSLRNSKGEMVQPSGRFWVSFKLPDDIDVSTVVMYESFYDGSLLPIKRVVMDFNNYISCEDFFASKVYALATVIPPEVEAEEEIQNIENDVIIEETPEEQEVVETPSYQTIIKRRRKKKNDSVMDYTWLWILIAVIAVVVVIATGLVIFLILRKKKKSRKENMSI